MVWTWPSTVLMTNDSLLPKVSRIDKPTYKKTMVPGQRGVGLGTILGGLPALQRRKETVTRVPVAVAWISTKVGPNRVPPPGLAIALLTHMKRMAKEWVAFIDALGRLSASPNHRSEPRGLFFFSTE